MHETATTTIKIIIGKYLNFSRVLKMLWNMNVTVIPVIDDALVPVPKDLEKRLGEF